MTYYTIPYISLFITKGVAAWTNEFQFCTVARNPHSFRLPTYSKISAHLTRVIRLPRAFPTNLSATYHWTRDVFLHSIQTWYGTYPAYPKLDTAVVSPTVNGQTRGANYVPASSAEI